MGWPQGRRAKSAARDLTAIIRGDIWKACFCIFLTQYSNGCLQTATFMPKEKINAARRPPRPPRGVTVERTEFGGIPCEVVKKAGNTRIPVFYIHGGGFTTGSARERRAITFYLCDRFGFDCIACDYRLAPEHKLPAAHEDCYAAYGAVVQRYPQVVLMGESAGGTLAVSVAMRALKEGIARPAAVAAFSPLAALNTDLPSHKTNVKTDYMLKRDPSSGELLKLICHENAGVEFFKDPIISPVYGTFNNFPPFFYRLPIRKFYMTMP